MHLENKLDFALRNNSDVFAVSSDACSIEVHILAQGWLGCRMEVEPRTSETNGASVPAISLIFELDLRSIETSFYIFGTVVLVVNGTGSWVT